MGAEQKYFIGIQDVGEGFAITNKALLEALTNTSNVHAERIGQGAEEKAVSRLSWVVVNWRLQVLRRPKVCRTILCRTWAREFTRVLGYRDYEVVDENGETVAIATSVWTALDTERGVPVRLTPELTEAYEAEPERASFPGYRFPRLAHAELPVLAEASFTVTRSMIDCNDHVHNPAYVDLANEVLPEDVDAGMFENMEISYKREVRRRETVTLQYSRDGERHIVTIRDPADGAIHAVVAFW